MIIAKVWPVHGVTVLSLDKFRKVVWNAVLALRRKCDSSLSAVNEDNSGRRYTEAFYSL